MSDASSTPTVWLAAWPWIRAILITFLGLLLAMTFLERWIVYPAPPVDRGDWQAPSLQHDDVWFTAPDGTRLHGWLFRHPDPQTAIVYCHGNGEHVADNAELVARMRDQLRATLFIFDYRGYGKSAGTPNEAGVISDGLAAQRWLANHLQLETSDLVLMGRSLGGGVATAMAAEQGAQSLILMSTFGRMTDVAATHYRWLPVRLLMCNRYDSIARIQQYKGPLLQSHGTADQIVPLEMGRQLFDAAPTSNKVFYELPGYGHNDNPPASFYHNLAEFLAANTANRP